MRARRLLTPVLVLGLNLVVAFVVAGAFWDQDWRYAQPAPRPAGLRQPVVGAPVATPGKRRLLHFTNPECPCSRFAKTEFEELALEYAGEVEFVAVATQPVETPRGVQLWTDPDGGIARRYGVFSTPQAVLLERDGTLVFRGNYNRGRYCRDPRTAWVRRVLEGWRSGTAYAPPKHAWTAYGCVLPSMTGNAGSRL